MDTNNKALRSLSDDVIALQIKVAALEQVLLAGEAVAKRYCELVDNLVEAHMRSLLTDEESEATSTNPKPC